MTEEQVKELVKTKREELSSLLPEEIKKKAEFCIDKIYSMLSFETRAFGIDFLIDFFKFVYDLPAAPEIDYFGAHHQQKFGLFLHSLEVCMEALKRTQDRSFIKQKDGIFFSATYYTTKYAIEYVIFLTSLCHDIGKVLTYKVTNKTQRTIHKPFLMSLYDFKKGTEDTEIEVEFTPYDHKHFSLVLFCLLTESDLKFITEPKPTQGYSLDALEYFFDILSGEGETEFGREILGILREADKASVVENIREEEPEYILIKQFLQKKYREYYDKKLLFKGEEYTALSFPFVIKEIIRNVLHIRVREEDRISNSILEKVISLLEEHINYSPEKSYLFLLKHKSKGLSQRRVLLLKNDFLDSVPASFPENLSEWEIISRETQQAEDKEEDIIPEEPESTAPPPIQKELPGEDEKQKKMYDYFKSIPIVECSSIAEIKANKDNRKAIIFKTIQAVFPTFDSDMLTSFLDKLQKEKETREREVK